MLSTPTNSLANVRTMDAVVSKSLARRRFQMFLLALFAALALALAAIGIYGVIAFAVGQRTREIGVRMAIGARPPDVLRLVLGRALLVIGLGIAVGLAGALAIPRLISGMLFGISPQDPVTYASVAALLAIVALFASYLPARRAMRIDPVVALRYE